MRTTSLESIAYRRTMHGIALFNGHKGVQLGLCTGQGFLVDIVNQNIESLSLPLPTRSLATLLVAVTRLLAEPQLVPGTLLSIKLLALVPALVKVNVAAVR